MELYGNLQLIEAKESIYASLKSLLYVHVPYPRSNNISMNRTVVSLKQKTKVVIFIVVFICTLYIVGMDHGLCDPFHKGFMVSKSKSCEICLI